MKLHFVSQAKLAKDDPICYAAYEKMSDRVGVIIEGYKMAAYQSKSYSVIGIKVGADVVIGVARKEDVDIFDSFHGYSIAWRKALENFWRWTNEG